MLKPFGRHEIMASGIMAWTGNWKELYDKFNYARDTGAFRGDQDYLTSQLMSKNNVGFIQDHVSGIYSYKYHCQEKLPDDARIVCFHGRPRPIETIHLEWVKNNWRI